MRTRFGDHKFGADSCHLASVPIKIGSGHTGRAESGNGNGAAPEADQFGDQTGRADSGQAQTVPNSHHEFGDQRPPADSGHISRVPNSIGSGQYRQAAIGHELIAAPDIDHEFGGQGPVADSGQRRCAPNTIGSGHGQGADSGQSIDAASDTDSEFGGQAMLAECGQAGHAPNKIGSGQTSCAESGHQKSAAPDADSGHQLLVEPKPNGGHRTTADNGHSPGAAVVIEQDQQPSADSGQLCDVLLDNLVTQCRLREDYHRAEKRLVLQIKSICRRRSGGKGKAADDMFAALTKRPDPETQGLFIALDVLREQRKLYERGVQRLAKELPCASWIETVPGVSFLSLGLVVAELEPILGHVDHAVRGHQGAAQRRQESRARYRMGLALVEGERQRKVKDKALAERMGYSPRRRSIMWNVGSCMIKAANRDTAPYYDIYLHRKDYEMARGIKRGHAHNRAARYMTTKLLRHFLAQWNAAANEAVPITAIPAGPPHVTWGQSACAERGHIGDAP